MRWSIVLCAAAVLSGLPPRLADAQSWPAVTQAELTLARSLIDAAADAEVLLWDVAISSTDSSHPTTTFDNVLRIKIFNERGRDAASRVDLNFEDGQSIRDIKGRTTAPNGTVTELAAADVRQRTILQATGVKSRVQSFVLPAVVPGAVIEYRWREIHEGEVANHLVLPFQREFPVQLVRYAIKPLALPDYRMRTHVFNATSEPQITEQNGYTVIQARALPAAQSEVMMPHEMAVGAWMFLYYANIDWLMDERAFWQKYSKEQADALSGQLKINGDLSKAAAEATAGMTTPAAKVQALVQYMRQRVRHVETPGSRPTDSARETLKRGTGIRQDLVVLFTALARAAGLDAYLARMPSRNQFVAAPRLKLPYFLSHLTTAIKVGTSWSFVDAANEHAPVGQLRWQQEGTYALVFDDDAPQFLGVGLSPREASRVRRTGTLRLLANGDLEGDVSIVYTGHFATQYRELGDAATPAERERLFTARISGYLPGSAVSNFRVENADDPGKPYVVRFSLSAPGFAPQTGTRLRLTAAALPRELGAPFKAVRRTRPVHFPFAWSEDDALTIELPDRYEVESISTPRPVSLKQDVGTLDVKLTVSGRTLTYTRAFAFGRDTVVFPVEEYPMLKTFFDDVRTADGSGLLLRRTGSDNAP